MEPTESKQSPALEREQPTAPAPVPWTPQVGASDALWSVGDILWGVLTALLSLMAAIAVATLVGRPFFSLAVSALVELLLLGVAWGLSVRRHRLRWEALGFRAPSRSAVLLVFVAVVLSLTITAVYTAIIRAMGFGDSLPPSPFLEGKNSVILAITAVLAIVAAPLCEETFFRGFVFGGLRRTLGLWGAALVSAGLFAIAHAAPVTFIPILGIGLVLAFVYARTGSLWYSVLVHLSYNSLVVYLSWRS